MKLNGTELKPTEYVHKPLDHPYESGLGEPSEYACFKCPRRLVHDGINKIALILEDHLHTISKALGAPDMRDQPYPTQIANIVNRLVVRFGRMTAEHAFVV